MPFLHEVDAAVKTVMKKDSANMENPLCKKLSSLYIVELS